MTLIGGAGWLGQWYGVRRGSRDSRREHLTGYTFCPRCGTERSGSLRFCASCAYDFAPDAASGRRLDTPSLEALVPPVGGTRFTPVAPSREWTAANLALVGAGIALIVAPFLPFISATVALAGNISRTGIEMVGPEAFILVVVGVLVAATGFQRASRKPMGRGLPLLASLAASGLTAYYFIQINDRVQGVSSDAGVASIGTGLWLAVAGSVVAVLVNLLAKPQQ